MKKRAAMVMAGLFVIASLGACGEDASSSGKEGEATTVSDIADRDDDGKENESTDPGAASDDQGAGDQSAEGAGTADPSAEEGDDEVQDIPAATGKVYKRIVITGIEDWQSVVSSIYGFENAFSITYMDPNGDLISGLYSPGTPDSLEFVFDTATGKAVRATYYGMYNTPEDAEAGKEALEENLDSFEGDIISVSVDGLILEVSFDPYSNRFDATVRTYFLEGRHDTEGYTESCGDIFDNAGSVYTDYKGDNYAMDVIHGYKVIWYE